MLPAKWKIFRFILYLYIVVTAGILLIYFIALRLLHYTNSIGFPQLVFLTWIFISLGHAGFCLYLVDRRYPDKPLGRAAHRGIVTLFVLHLISLLALLVIFAYGFYEEFFMHPKIYWRSTGIQILLVLAAIIGLGIYICWLQPVLRRTIRRNFEIGLDGFLKGD